jgi:hypothetical protein
MKRLVLGTTVLAMLSGIALATPAAAGSLSHRERAAIANSQKNLAALKWRVRADGKVSWFERMRVNAAQSRHNALVHRSYND